MTNYATITGHLGAAPEIRNTNSGRPVANFSVATNTRWTDRATGELCERTEWHRIVVWSPAIIDLLTRGLLLKGSQVFVQGEIRTRQYEADAKDPNGVLILDKAGNRIKYRAYSTEIVLAQGSQLEVMGKRPTEAPEMRPSTMPRTNGVTPIMPDEDMPFPDNLTPAEATMETVTDSPDHCPV